MREWKGKSVFRRKVGNGVEVRLAGLNVQRKSPDGG